jgi:hypothetical protein
VVLYVPVIANIKDTAGYLALGVSFAVGRTIHEFLSGCIFLFFKHAYDIGDRVEIFNMAATSSISATVSRISVLYTIFTCTADGKDIQISNDRLNLKRIINVTRSGANKEAVSIFVDFNTTFTDIQYLQKELQKFLSDRSNSRDFLPAVKIRLKNIFELNKLELKCSFSHKSNWSNEDLRAARSSKFLCALLTAIRKIPLNKPGGPDILGMEGKPAYTVMLSDEQGKAKLDASKQKILEKRKDFLKSDDKPCVAPQADGGNEQGDGDPQHVREVDNNAEAAEKAKRDDKDSIEQSAYKELTAVPWVPGPGPLNREYGGKGTGTDAGMWNLGASSGVTMRGLRRKVRRDDRSAFYPG